jgi:tetratricopeptide (TPR) repeat protein
MIRPDAVLVLLAPMAALVGVQPVAAADEPPPEVAKLYQQGAKEYRLGHFRRALTRFRSALALTEGRPSLLFNIAQCYRQLGTRRQAIFYYKLYLSEFERLNPGEAVVPYAAEVRVHLRRLEAETTAPATKFKASPAPATATRLRAPPVTEAPRSHDTPAPGPTHSPFYKRWWFWTIVGVVVAGATTATVIALQPTDVEAPVGNLAPGQIWVR